MKVLLVNPPRSPENDIYRFAPAEAKPFIHRKLIGPPLGLITVAAAARDFDLTVLDMKAEYDLDADAPQPRRLARNWMDRVEPDVVGVTFIASEYNAGMDILREAKARGGNVITVAGGLHTTLCPDDFADPAVDAVLPGASAAAFGDLLRALDRGAAAESVPGILLNRDGRLVPTGGPGGSGEPAGRDFIMPDRSHLSRWLTTYRAGGSPLNSTYVFTSLGCPYRCTFCSIWPQYGGRYMMRDVESVIEELRGLDDYGVVRFSDANTIVDTDYISRLFDRIAAESIKKTFVMDIRFDTAVNHPRLIEKLARGGLRVVICGFESFREEELRRYRKGANPGLIEEAIRVFHDNGIMLRGNYVVPPDYGMEDFRALADYASGHRVVYAGYTVLTPMPGTEYWRSARESIIDANLDRYNFFNSVFRTALPVERFYEEVGRLWLIRQGTDVI